MDDETENKEAKKYPLFIIVIGILGLVPVFFVLISSGTVIGIVLPMVIAALVPLVFLYGGIRRIMEIKKRN
jgi:uncharacterized membrane protein